MFRYLVVEAALGPICAAIALIASRAVCRRKPVLFLTVRTGQVAGIAPARGP